MNRFLTALLWATAIVHALAARVVPFLVLFFQEALSFRQALLLPAGQEPAPQAEAEQPEQQVPADPDLFSLTRRELQALVGTKRNLPKATLIEMAQDRLPVMHAIADFQEQQMRDLAQPA